MQGTKYLTVYYWLIDFNFFFHAQIYFYVSCRGIDALPINVDPIPEDITQGFGLLRLRDVSVLLL